MFRESAQHRWRLPTSVPLALALSILPRFSATSPPRLFSFRRGDTDVAGVHIVDATGLTAARLPTWTL